MPARKGYYLKKYGLCRPNIYRNSTQRTLHSRLGETGIRLTKSGKKIATQWSCGVRTHDLGLRVRHANRLATECAAGKIEHHNMCNTKHKMLDVSTNPTNDLLLSSHSKQLMCVPDLFCLPLLQTINSLKLSLTFLSVRTVKQRENRIKI